jgi:hypothetical protein
VVHRAASRSRAGEARLPVAGTACIAGTMTVNRAANAGSGVRTP